MGLPFPAPQEANYSTLIFQRKKLSLDKAIYLFSQFVNEGVRRLGNQKVRD